MRDWETPGRRGPRGGDWSFLAALDLIGGRNPLSFVVAHPVRRVRRAKL